MDKSIEQKIQEGKTDAMLSYIPYF